ncbi:MAG: VOC family protein [Burkholderiaceae bacterium]
MPQAIPYLSFNGDCAQAVAFYAGALRGELRVMVRNDDLPAAAGMPEAPGDFVVHAAVELPGGGFIYAGDCPPHLPYEGIKGVSLTLDYDSVDEARRIFEALCAGGRTTMPFGPQFWAEASGMATDRFGATWIVNGPRKKV